MRIKAILKSLDDGVPEDITVAEAVVMGVYWAAVSATMMVGAWWSYVVLWAVAG